MRRYRVPLVIPQGLAIRLSERIWQMAIDRNGLHGRAIVPNRSRSS
jgi:hypothetical protein